jgi:4-amino-4-deoxy-L-arabinose transferase-like glycosyltransferase
MNRQTFAWDGSRNKLRQEIRWLEFLSIAGLFVAALILFCIDLGSLPLGEEERAIEQVAKMIVSAPLNELQWLFPTLKEQPHFALPPLLHSTIALFYKIAGNNAWTTRLPGAILAACSVPLLYNLGRELFVKSTPALFSAAIYLTLFPVVRHGRATLDGAVLCFSILTAICVARSRRDLRWALGAGIGLSLLALSQGMVGTTIVAILLVFLAWDTPRLLSSGFFAVGILLGGAPAIAWYASQFFRSGFAFAGALFAQAFPVKVVDGYSIGLSWYHLVEIVTYSSPWLIFSLSGLRLAWRERNWGWAKLIVVWSGLLVAILSLFSTHYTSAIATIYPALALAGGAALAEAVNLPITRPYPRFWRLSLSILAIVPVAILVFALFSNNFSVFQTTQLFSWIILGAISFTWAVGAILLHKRSAQFIAVLFWGMYVCLLLTVCFPNWLYT